MAARSLSDVSSARRTVLLLGACSAIGLALGVGLGVGYATRSAAHAGFYRVTVHDDGPDTRAFVRPRRTVIFVVDGLGHEEAERMPALDRLADVGQCRTTAVGPLSVSRPVYAVISTGLDQDRTGARGNDDTSALAAQSIWALARARGLFVAGVSEVPWWRELFPDGFDHYDVVPPEEDYVRRIAPADLQLVHPVYVDDVGHVHGAASPEYADAVARVGREIDEVAAELDLVRDLLIVTADHGQMLAGGHGGRQPRVAWVRTCFAGRGVAHLEHGARMRSTTIAPAVSVLLGLPFPSDMRAGEDELDRVFEIADAAAFPPGYLDERRETVARFRRENAAALRSWLPASEGLWSRFRDHHRARQARGLVPCLGLALVVLAVLAHVHRRAGRSFLPGIALVVLVPTGFVALQLAFRGSFDLGSVSTRAPFLAFTIGMASFVCTVAMTVLVRVRRAIGAVAADWTALSLVGSLLAIAHPLVFGWVAGYPAPPAELFFYPYFVTLTFGVVHACGLVLAAFALGDRRCPTP